MFWKALVYAVVSIGFAVVLVGSLQAVADGVTYVGLALMALAAVSYPFATGPPPTSRR